MKKTTLDALNKWAYEKNGQLYVDIKDDSFAEACCNCNNIADLEEEISNSQIKSDCETWGITKSEWKESIERALVWHVLKWIR